VELNCQGLIPSSFVSCYIQIRCFKLLNFELLIMVGLDYFNNMILMSVCGIKMHLLFFSLHL